MGNNTTVLEPGATVYDIPGGKVHAHIKKAEVGKNLLKYISSTGELYLGFTDIGHDKVTSWQDRLVHTYWVDNGKAGGKADPADTHVAAYYGMPDAKGVGVPEPDLAMTIDHQTGLARETRNGILANAGVVVTLPVNPKEQPEFFRQVGLVPAP